MHGGGGCVVAVVVSFVVVAKMDFSCVDFCFDFLWVSMHVDGGVGCCSGGASDGFPW